MKLLIKRTTEFSEMLAVNTPCCLCLAVGMNLFGYTNILAYVILQSDRSRWYGHVFRKDDSEWVKKCMDFVVEGVKCGG